MRSRVTVFVILLACILAIAVQALGGIGTGFIENRGQVDSRVKYYAPGSRATVYFTQDAVVIDLKEEVKSPQSRAPHEMPYEEMMAELADSVVQRGCALYIRFEGANPSPVVEARGELVTKYNYFLGNDPTGWRTDVPAYSEVVYREVWPGVDLVFREEDGGRLTYVAVLSPGADGQIVQFCYEGADRVVQKSDGSFLMETSGGSLREERAVAGGRSGVFMLAQGNGEPLGSSGSTSPEDNPSVLLWSTYLGGSDDDWGYSLVLDASGNAVVTGYARASDFPTTPGAYDTSHNGGRDAFVAKLSASGSALLWSTFLGGVSYDEGRSLVLDGSGNVVVTGYTGYSDFPTTLGAYDTSHNGNNDIFVAKLSASGSALLWSTFLGGSDDDGGGSLVLDASGNVVVAGWTVSPNFPTTLGAYDRSYNGGEDDVCVAKLSASGSVLLWSTFLGGSDDDAEFSLALDASGSPVVTGATSSSNFPTTPGAYDTSFNGQYGDYDGFITKLSASGSALTWGTFLGGSSYDDGYSMALDASGNAVVTGTTRSSDFPTTPGAYDTSYNGGYWDGFVAKLSASGSALLWSTFLGGSVDDDGYSLVLDASGNAVVTGMTGSPDFPTMAGAYDTSFNGSSDVFVAKLSASGSALLWSTFLGGSDGDWGYSLALDASGNAVVTGRTRSSDLPTTPGAYDTSFNNVYGWSDVFVANLGIGCAGVRREDATLGSAKLYPNFPDPFRASTTVQFYLPEQQRVSIALYDVRGEVVRTLVDGITEVGMHELRWDGKTGNETQVAAGIYFLRMEVGSYRATTKVVMLR